MTVEIVNAVRKALRIRGDALDSEILETIEACREDLELMGVQYAYESFPNPLIQRAIILYARAAFDFEGQGDRYQRGYDALKCRLSLARKYRNE